MNLGVLIFCFFRSIKEEKELEGGKMPKMTHKLTVRNVFLL